MKFELGQLIYISRPGQAFIWMRSSLDMSMWDAGFYVYSGLFMYLGENFLMAPQNGHIGVKHVICLAENRVGFVSNTFKFEELPDEI